MGLLATVISALAVGSLNVAAQTTAGAISGTETWSGTVTLTGDVRVVEGGQLTLQPGTIVRAVARSDAQGGGEDAARIELRVEGGILLVNGTAASPITLTSAGATPAPGDWHGLVVRYGTVTLRQVRQEYGVTGLSVLGGGDYLFEQTSWQHNEQHGVWLNYQGLYTFSGLTAANNGDAGFRSEAGNAAVSLLDGEFVDNGSPGQPSVFLAGNSTLERVRITRSRGSGLQVSDNNRQQATHAWTDLTVTDSAGTGIEAIYYQRIVLKGAAVLRNGSMGLFSNGGQLVVEDGQFNFNVTHGIYGGNAALNLSQLTVNNNGGSGIAGISLPEPATITDCTVTANVQSGVSLSGGGVIRGCAVRNNGVGVEIAWSNPAGVVEVTGSDLLGNPGGDLKNSGQAAIVAAGNFFGATTTDQLKAGNLNPPAIYSGLDDPAWGQVLIRTFAESSVINTSPPLLPLSYPPVAGATRLLSGRISANQTWSGVVVLTGDVVIPDGVTVTVESGTQVVSAARWDDSTSGADASGVELILDGGSLLMNGTATSPITLTSAGATPALGDWYGLVVRYGTVSLRQVKQEYGVTGLSVLGGGDYVFEQTSWQHNEQHGVWLNYQGLYAFSGLTVANNGGWGFRSDAMNATVSLVDGEFSDNSSPGQSSVFLAGNSTLERVRIARSRGSGLQVSDNNRQQATHAWTDLTVTDSAGTGIEAISYQRIVLKGATVLRNRSMGLYGNGGQLVVEDGQFNFNAGRGVFDVSTTAELSRLTVNNNGAGIALSGTATITDCTVTANAEAGISLSGGGVIRGCAVRNNGVGVEIAWSNPAGVVEVTGSDLLGNPGGDLKNSGQAEVLANGNYWGVTTTDELTRGVVNLTRILDRHDNPAWGVVTIDQWRTGSISETALSIGSQPQPLTVNTGETAVFAVTASGPGTLSYQWRKGTSDLTDGGRVSGAQSAQLTLSSAAPADAGEYSVEVTSSGGGTTNSQPALLIVIVPNRAPVVTLTSPATGAMFTVPATLALAANASDPDDGVMRVEFFANATRLGEATSPPYVFTWTDVSPGNYSLTARATDHAGASSTSVAVNVSVQEAGSNTPPTISKIPNQQVETNAHTGWIAFTIGDTQTAADQLALSAHSSDTNVVPTEWISFEGTGTNRWVLVKRMPGSDTPVEITITVADAEGLTATSAFTVRVCPCLELDLYAVLAVRGIVGREYVIEYREEGLPNDEPKTWSFLMSVVLQESPQRVVDVSGPARGRRLYRTTLKP